MQPAKTEARVARQTALTAFWVSLAAILVLAVFPATLLACWLINDTIQPEAWHWTVGGIMLVAFFGSLVLGCVAGCYAGLASVRGEWGVRLVLAWVLSSVVLAFHVLASIPGPFIS